MKKAPCYPACKVDSVVDGACSCGGKLVPSSEIKDEANQGKDVYCCHGDSVGYYVLFGDQGGSNPCEVSGGNTPSRNGGGQETPVTGTTCPENQLINSSNLKTDECSCGASGTISLYDVKVLEYYHSPEHFYCCHDKDGYSKKLAKDYPCSAPLNNGKVSGSSGVGGSGSTVKSDLCGAGLWNDSDDTWSVQAKRFTCDSFSVECYWGDVDSTSCPNCLKGQAEGSCAKGYKLNLENSNNGMLSFNCVKDSSCSQSNEGNAISPCPVGSAINHLDSACECGVGNVVKPSDVDRVVSSSKGSAVYCCYDSSGYHVVPGSVKSSPCKGSVCPVGVALSSPCVCGSDPVSADKIGEEQPDGKHVYCCQRNDYGFEVLVSSVNPCGGGSSSSSSSGGSGSGNAVKSDLCGASLSDKDFVKKAFPNKGCEYSFWINSINSNSCSGCSGNGDQGSCKSGYKLSFVKNAGRGVCYFNCTPDPSCSSSSSSSTPSGSGSGSGGSGSGSGGSSGGSGSGSGSKGSKGKSTWTYYTSQHGNAIIYTKNAKTCNKIEGHSRFSNNSDAHPCKEKNRCTKDGKGLIDFICYDTTSISNGDKVYKGKHCTSYVSKTKKNEAVFSVKASDIYGSMDQGDIYALSCSGSWGKGKCIRDKGGVAHCCLEEGAGNKYINCSKVGCCPNSGLTCDASTGKCEKSSVEKCSFGFSSNSSYCDTSDASVEYISNEAGANYFFVYGNVTTTDKGNTRVEVYCDESDKTPQLAKLESTDKNNVYSFNVTCKSTSPLKDGKLSFSPVVNVINGEHKSWCDNTPKSLKTLSFIKSSSCPNSNSKLSVGLNNLVICNNTATTFSITDSFDDGVNLTFVNKKGNKIQTLLCLEDGSCSINITEDNTKKSYILNKNHQVISLAKTLFEDNTFHGSMILYFYNKASFENVMINVSVPSGEFVASSPFTITSDASKCGVPKFNCKKNEESVKDLLASRLNDEKKNCSTMDISDINAFLPAKNEKPSPNKCCSYYEDIEDGKHYCYYSPTIEHTCSEDGKTVLSANCSFTKEEFDPNVNKCSSEGLIPLHETNCNDGKDNNKNGLTDCLDADCYTKAKNEFNWLDFARRNVHSTPDCVPSIPKAYPGCGIAQCGQFAGSSLCDCWNKPIDTAPPGKKICELKPYSDVTAWPFNKYANYLGLKVTPDEIKCIDAGGFCIDRKYLNDTTYKGMRVYGVCNATPGLADVIDKDSNLPMFCGSCNVMCCKVKLPDTVHNCGASGQSCCLSGCANGLSCCYDKSHPYGICKDSCNTKQAAIHLFTQGWGLTASHYIYGTLLSGKCFTLKVDSEGKIISAQVCGNNKGGDCSHYNPKDCTLTYGSDKVNQELGSQLSNVINQYITFLQATPDQTVAGNLLKNPGFEEGNKYWVLSGSSTVDKRGGVLDSNSLYLDDGSAYQKVITDYAVGDSFILSAQRAVSNNNCKFDVKVGLVDPSSGKFVSYNESEITAKTSKGFMMDKPFVVGDKFISQGYVLEVKLSSSSDCPVYIDNLVLRKSSGSVKNTKGGYGSLCGPADESVSCDDTKGLVCEKVQGTYRCGCPPKEKFENGICSGGKEEGPTMNLLTNGDFEDVSVKGNLEYWQPHGTGVISKCSGSNSVVVGKNLPYILHDPIYLDAGTYFFESECKPEGSGQGKPNIEIRLTPADKKHHFDDYFDSSYDMRAFEHDGMCNQFVYVDKPGKYYFSVFGYYKSKDISSIFSSPPMCIDNLKLIRVPYTLSGSGNLLSNPSFERGLSSWKVEKGNPQASVECMRKGTKGLLLADKDKTASVYQLIQGEKLEPGVYYFMADCDGAMDISGMSSDANGNEIINNVNYQGHTFRVGSLAFDIVRRTSKTLCAVKVIVDPNTRRCGDPRNQDYSNLIKYKHSYMKNDEWADLSRKQLFDNTIPEGTVVQFVATMPLQPPSQYFKISLTQGGTSESACVDNVILESEGNFIKDLNDYYSGKSGDNQNNNNENNADNNNQNEQNNDNGNEQNDEANEQQDKDHNNPKKNNPEEKTSSLSSSDFDPCHVDFDYSNKLFFGITNNKVYLCDLKGESNTPDYGTCKPEKVCDDDYSPVRLQVLDNKLYVSCSDGAGKSEFCEYTLGNSKDDISKDFCEKVKYVISDFSLDGEGGIYFITAEGSSSHVVYEEDFSKLPLNSVDSLSNVLDPKGEYSNPYTALFYDSSSKDLYYSYEQNENSFVIFKKDMTGSNSNNQVGASDHRILCIRKVAGGHIKAFYSKEGSDIDLSQGAKVGGGVSLATK